MWCPPKKVSPKVKTCENTFVSVSVHMGTRVTSVNACTGGMT